MSRLEELIAELCPNGVDIKALDEVCTFNRGTPLVSKNAKPGNIPVISGGQKPAFYHNESNRADISITVAGSGAYAGFVSIWYEPIFCSDAFTVDPIDENQLNIKYLFYYLANNQMNIYHKKTGAGIPHVHGKDLAKFKIPVPPLEVQREIVRILDSFTLLTAELTAELTDRKKQYEFYRNKMLTFDTKVTRKRLGEIFDFRNGLSKGKEFFGSGTPFIRYTDVYNHRSLRKEDITALVECTSSELEKLRVSRGDVLFTRTSETAEDVGWSSVMLDDIGDCVFNGFTIKATPKTDDLLPEYCAYCFATDSFRNYVTTHCAFTTRASLTGNTIADYQIAIPSIDEQQRIVNVLGNFESICSDLNSGLPAEIAARQKQYEYYRDKLLSFEEVK